MSENATAGVPDEAVPAKPAPLRRNSGFRMLWIGQVLSGTGTEAALVAYPLLLLALTRSAVIAGAVDSVALAVWLAFTLPGGALADRLDRRLTMIACDSVRAAALALLAVLVLAHLATWQVVLAVAIVDNAANALFDPAASAALPAIVHDDHLEQAWAATEARTSAASLAGPALGGLLFGLGRAVPFLFDAVSYLVSAGTASRLRGRFRHTGTVARRALWRETADGIRLVVRNPLLRAGLITGPLINFSYNGVLFTITVALRQHGTAPAVIGLAQAGIAVGGLLGAIGAPWMQRRLSMRRQVIALNVTGTVMFAVGALVLPSPLVAVPVAAVVLLAPAANAALSAMEVRITPEHMRGRVTSTMFLGTMSITALAPLTAGVLVQHVSGQWAMATFAATMGGAAIVSVLSKGLRTPAVPADSANLSALLDEERRPGRPQEPSGYRASVTMPEDVRPLLDRFAADAGAVLPLEALWAHGSLALGDYQPGRSDLDLVALIATAPASDQQEGLRQVHEALHGTVPLADKLHCAYVVRAEAGDPGRGHLTWAEGELFVRVVSPVSRRELHQGGLCLLGPAPSAVVPPVSDQELADYIRADLRDFYLPHTDQAAPWLQDIWVDLGLLTFARASVTLRDGRLITKREALEVLASLDAPPGVVRDIYQRRYESPPPISDSWRAERGEQARTYLREAIKQLLAPD